MNTWQLFPTAKRRFVHLQGVMLCYNRRADKWSAVFHHDHTEVWQRYVNRLYNNLTEKQMNRILSVCGLKIHYWELGASKFINLDKPIPMCMYPDCARPAVVPTYHENSKPYYCVNHRN